MSDQSDLNS